MNETCNFYARVRNSVFRLVFRLFRLLGGDQVIICSRDRFILLAPDRSGMELTGNNEEDASVTLRSFANVLRRF